MKETNIEELAYKYRKENYPEIDVMGAIQTQTDFVNGYKQALKDLQKV